MNTQLTSALRRLFSAAYILFSNPQTVRLAILVIVVCFALATLCIPALSALANGLPGGGGSGATPAP